MLVVYSISFLVYLKKITNTRLNFLKAIPLTLRCLAVIFLVVALARPQKGSQTREILSHGVDIMLAIDTSGSMQQIWDRVMNEISNILDIHPKVEGFQILNDNG